MKSWTSALGGLLAVLGVMAAGCSQKVELSKVAPQAHEAIKAELPAATEKEASREDKGGVKCYEASLVQDGRTIDLLVSQDGTIIEVETEVPMSDVPQPAADTIAKAAKGAPLIKLEKVENRAKVSSGRITKLDKPEVFFEAKFRQWGLVRELKVAPDGTIVD